MSIWRADITGASGIFDVRINFPSGIVDRHAVVLVSVCEIVIPLTNDLPYKGNAVLTVHNVVPNDGGFVELTIDTGQEWSPPIGVRAHFSIEPWS